MDGSLERVRCVMNGRRCDRAPLFDLVPNDAVLAYFNGGAPVEPGDDRAGARALARAVDSTRFSYFSPNAERVETSDDGRERRYERWTVWTSERKFSSSEEYARIKKKEMARAEKESGKEPDFSNDDWYQRHLKLLSWFGEDFYFLLYGPSPGLMEIYMEVGLEQFCYYLADCEGVIIEQLERNTASACRWAAALPDDDPFETVFIGEDIAFKTGPMVSPAWLEKHYFHRLKRVVDAIHARGKKVMFHSDGNLNAIMDGLAATGIDALNPIEVGAGMDLADLHRRYPDLVFAGGIDVSNLLPFGTPAEVRDAAVKAIEDTEGKILVGSSTEVTDCVPLENFLAMREAAMNYRF